METPTPSTQAPQSALANACPAPVVPVASNAHAFSSACANSGCVACLDKRARKAAQNAKSRGKVNPFERTAGAPPVAESGSAMAKVIPLASALPPVAAPKPAVPWTVSIVRPLVVQAANLAEKWGGDNLIEEAAKVSDTVRDFIRANVAWNAEAKAMLVDGAAECAVKYLNLTGISAEYAPELKFGLGALAIVSARQSLVSELRKMAAEEAARRKKVTDQAEAKAA
jgi:hypothetical protein